MHPSIVTVHDSKRGCGFRKLHGCYFRCDNPGIPCGVLPLELKPCPICAAQGLKCRTAPTRGFTWIDPSKLFDWKNISCDFSSKMGDSGLCSNCSMSRISKMNRIGLLWVGGKYYETPEDFDKEARELGISRRLPHDHIPRDFKIGVDSIMLAHRKAVLRLGGAGEITLMDYFPGVFRVFRPDRIEVVVSGEETDEEIDALIERGLTPVKVERA